MGRTLTFEQITDSRFNNNIKELLEERHEKLIHSLRQHESLTVKHNEIQIVDFTNTSEGNTQYRIRYWIQKEGRKLTWNDVYKLVNSIKAVPYDFV